MITPGGVLWVGYSDVVNSNLPNVKAAKTVDPPWLTATVLIAAGIFFFWCAANSWEPAGWNFVGASFLALGGIFGAMSNYQVVEHETRPWSWGLIVIGGAVVAGAAFPAALAAM